MSASALAATLAAALAAGQTATTGLRWLTEPTTPAEAEITPGWIAFALVVGLCVVTTLLWLSMRKQLGKIRFEEQDTPRRGRPPEPPSQ